MKNSGFTLVEIMIVVAILLGFWALRDIKNHPEILTGKRFSISGIVLGIISCLVSIGIYIYHFVTGQPFSWFFFQ